MALAVNSRFAVLSVDDDDDVKKSSKKKTNANSNNSGQKNDSKKKDVKKPNSAKCQTSNGSQSTISKNKNSKVNKKKANADEKQWEQWKQKDEEMVNGNYENELHEAILLSQLDYEKKKDFYAAAAVQAKEQETNNSNNASKKEKEKKQKKNKPITMSLNEFNNMMDPTPPQETGGKGDASSANVVVEEADPEFFDRVKEDAKKVLHREKQVEKRKAREPFVNQEIALARLEEKLERKDKELARLTEEVTRLKEELKTVRARNRDLCLIMSQGEMKDKAEVLVAMEKTTLVKDELSGEVERLHALLEQERSKVRALTQHGDKNKSKNKKRTASENN